MCQPLGLFDNGYRETDYQERMGQIFLLYVLLRNPILVFFTVGLYHRKYIEGTYFWQLSQKLW